MTTVPEIKKFLNITTSQLQRIAPWLAGELNKDPADIIPDDLVEFIRDDIKHNVLIWERKQAELTRVKPTW